MSSSHLLRSQVRAEIKKRRHVVYTAILLTLIYIAFNILFSDTGLLRLGGLKQKRDALSAEVSAMKKDNARLQSAIKSYRENEYLIEKHAREDFNLSKPDEYVFVYDR